MHNESELGIPIKGDSCADSGHHCHSIAAGVSLSVKDTTREYFLSTNTCLPDKMTDNFTTELNYILLNVVKLQEDCQLCYGTHIFNRLYNISGTILRHFTECPKL